MLFRNASCDPELLKLMTGALDAAWQEQCTLVWDNGIAHDLDAARQEQRALVWDNEPARTAMALEIMTAVEGGERDPSRLKLAALKAVNGRSAAPGFIAKIGRG